MSTLADLVDCAARQALSEELLLDPKPGLVTPHSTGSHPDMDHHHFRTSIAALAGYFGDCVRLGTANADFDALRERGLTAEAAMFAATDGVNTHKGAIFTLGLLAGAIGLSARDDTPLVIENLGTIVTARWGAAIMAAAALAPDSHGRRVLRELGLPGAREHAAGGLPVLFETTLPALRHAREHLGHVPAASLHALMSSVAVLADTNLAHRGGRAGLEFARHEANRFLSGGSVFAPGWSRNMIELGERFVARRLSPGGSADLLAAALMLCRVQALNGTLRANAPGEVMAT